MTEVNNKHPTRQKKCKKKKNLGRQFIRSNHKRYHSVLMKDLDDCSRAYLKHMGGLHCRVTLKDYCMQTDDVKSDAVNAPRVLSGDGQNPFHGNFAKARKTCGHMNHHAWVGLFQPA